MFLLNARVMRMANDAEAQQNKERRLAAVAEGEAAEKKRREAAEAEKLAKQQQAERDFKAQLTRLNAGQLYVMADEMKTAGKPAQAREALHALITRFPDHALAGNAASMLATLK
jgi:TolA-binding protein